MSLYGADVGVGLFLNSTLWFMSYIYILPELLGISSEVQGQMFVGKDFWCYAVLNWFVHHEASLGHI